MWKAQLFDGQVEVATAAAVGELLGTLHAASAGDVTLAAEFATDDNFHALRIEPYLLATAAAHPDLGDVLRGLAHRTATTHLALVHGDVSPKNILVGPAGPVLLDAECAWYGDPAFDLAFCVNHLLLKSLVVPGHRADLLGSARVWSRSTSGASTGSPGRTSRRGVRHCCRRCCSRGWTASPRRSTSRTTGTGCSCARWHRPC